MIPFQNNFNYTPQNNKRKCKQGDWICMRCNNYNYAFRDICNRCRCQTRISNQYALSLIGKQNYGQNSFPSALFLSLQTPKQKEKEITFKQTSKKVFKQRNLKQLNTGDQNNYLNNIWINNLINE